MSVEIYLRSDPQRYVADHTLLDSSNENTIATVARDVKMILRVMDTTDLTVEERRESCAWHYCALMVYFPPE